MLLRMRPGAAKHDFNVLIAHPNELRQTFHDFLDQGIFPTLEFICVHIYSLPAFQPLAFGTEGARAAPR